MSFFLHVVLLASVPFVTPYGNSQWPLLKVDGSAPGNTDLLLNSKVDSALQSILEDFKSPGGIGVAVVRKNKPVSDWIVETKGYGTSKVDGTPVTSDTLFAIGSNSKLFDILATGLLISNESLIPQISWDTKITSIVPEWELMDPVASAESTIVDVMSHRTGLPRHDHLIAPSDHLDIIRRLRYVKPSTGFRELWQYNNHMYTLLSYLPALLVGTSFENYVNDFILQPLGMRSTTYFSERAEESGNFADGMARDGVNRSDDVFGLGRIRVLPYWAPSKGDLGHVMSGAGNLISSANDMAIWLQMLLGDGKHPTEDKNVIPLDVVHRVAAGVTVALPTAPFPELSPVVYGGGQSRGTYRGFEYIEHGGYTPGFRSQVLRMVNQTFGVAIFSNDDSFGTEIVEAVKFRIMDAALALEPIEWSARFKSATAALFNDRIIPTPRPKNASLPSFPLAALAGKYRDSGYGTIELCLLPPTGSATAISDSCRDLIDGMNLNTTLPDIIDPEIPTFLTKWPVHNSEHITRKQVSLTYFEHNLFNLTAFESFPTRNSSEQPYWVRARHDLNYAGAPGNDPNLVAEFFYDGTLGIGIRGLWGAGADVPSLQGNTVKKRADVWFEKLD